MNKKWIKRTLALTLAFSMTAALTACGGSKDSGSSGDSGSSSGGTAYEIGFNVWGTGDPTFDLMFDVADQALDVYGVHATNASDDNQADKELQNIQNFISAGVDGILMQTTAESVLPQAAQECQQAKIPFVLSTFVGLDEDREDLRENNEYYVGAVDSNLYNEGYLIGQEAAADGIKNVVLIGGNVGDNNFELRIEGFTKSFVEEGGGKILDSARCANPSEGQEKANALLSANPDAEAVYVMVGSYVPGTVSAKETLGMDIPMYVTNANSDTVPYIRDGSVAAATSGNELVGAVAAALLINYLDGHQILDADGKAPQLTNTGFVVDQDNIDDFEALFVNDLPYTEEVLQTLVWRYNSDVTYDTFVDFVENHLNLDALKADRA
jgi:ABC-type sugar transport system substrate-binding protein